MEREEEYVLKIMEYGDHTRPPIPEGWKHTEGEWDTGFVIQDPKGNEFIWVPVGFLDADGTLDGFNFTEKFGRRNYKTGIYKVAELYDAPKLGGVLLSLLESIKKYGGFYISRYNVSKGENGEPRSVKGAKPWTDIDVYDALRAARSFGDTSTWSDLTWGAEHDSMMEWCIKSEARTREEVEENSSNWGNFADTQGSSKMLEKTGTCEEYATNRIYDLAGNVAEWTQEHDGIAGYVIRGGCYKLDGSRYPAAYRTTWSGNKSNDSTGFRAVLHIK